MPFDITLPDGEPTPPELARLAGLRYVTDADPGITRQAADEGFAYRYPDGRPVRKKAHLSRIAALAIPPAWQDVWICRRDDGHLQATGRDDRGRKQYRYHERWGEISNLAKFSRMHDFGRRLPMVRGAVREALAREREPTCHRMSAVLVALLDRTFARVGNEEYVRANNSFGLSTLRRRHASFENGSVRLEFSAKGGKERALIVDDPALTRALAECVERRGRRLFEYLDGDGKRQPLESDEVNDWIRDASGEDFTAKDFRTWKASALVARWLYDHRREGAEADEDGRADIIRDAIDHAAERLANTRDVCRRYYVHPVLIESFEDGSFLEAVADFHPADRKWLDDDEQILLRVLRHFEA